MRLGKVEHGHGLLTKLLMFVLRLVSGRPVPDIVRTSLYGYERFGRPFMSSTQEALRGPSEWSVGERELFAAFVSTRNRCAY